MIIKEKSSEKRVLFDKKGDFVNNFSLIISLQYL